MSGIFGYVQSMAGVRDIKTAMKKLQSWNHAYGRDAREVFADESFGVGCCYEKLSADTKQSMPVLKGNGRYAVVDALLYNRKELMEKCQRKENLSDEELLLCYIDSFGMDALEEVNGDFCGAIYDDNAKSLVLFRDHLGVRPLYYFTNSNLVAFSSDIRGLTSLSQVDASVNEDWIFKTVAGYSTIGTENTEFEHIFCVKPGGYIKISFIKNGLKTEKNTYWQIGSRKIRLSCEEAYRDRLRGLITDSVKRRLDAVSGLVGAELSGGLDSGVIDILINRLGRECVYFSWSVAPEELPMAEGDERLVIEDICQQEKLTCNYGKMSMELGPESNIAESMRQTGVDLKLEEMPAFRYALPPYINALTICEASQYINRSGARVVFSGHGGDEGVSHRSNPYEMFYHKEYFHFFKYMWLAARGQKHRIIRTLKNSRKLLKDAGKMPYRPFRMAFASPELLKKNFADKFSENDMPVLHFAYAPEIYIKEGGSRNRLDNVALLGAYSGVRYLVPYLDYRVVDFAVSIPRHLYLKGDQNRYIFREAFKDIMPESLYTLHTKEDNSRKNMTKRADWFEQFAKKKADTVNKLNREYWGKYLNFDVIDEWVKRDKPSDEDRFHEECILMCLFSCALVENLVEKSREV